MCAVFNVKSAWRQQGITLQGRASLKDFVSSHIILLVKESELEVLQLTDVLEEVMQVAPAATENVHATGPGGSTADA